MRLSDKRIQTCTPLAKPQKLFDGGGLFLLVTPSGNKWWRLKYRFGGREKLLSLGVYPDVSLKRARLERDAARQRLAAGNDPSEDRKAKRAAFGNTFESVALEWLDKREDIGVATRHKIKRRLEIDVFPRIGNRPVSELTAAALLEVLQRVEKRGARETAHRLLNDMQRIFSYCVASSRLKTSPAVHLDGALKPVVVRHRASITEPSAIAPLLRAIQSYGGTAIVRCALQMAPLVFVRPGELRHAKWEEFDLQNALWSIPAERMKMKHPHLVPLSRQAVDILSLAHSITGGCGYVFPSTRSADRPLSENTLNAALQGMGYGTDLFTAHGFRAMARTVLDEVIGVRPDFIEHQLAHAVRDPNGRAYNRTAHLPERRKMMQQWADYLDRLKRGA